MIQGLILLRISSCKDITGDVENRWPIMKDGFCAAAESVLQKKAR